MQSQSKLRRSLLGDFALDNWHDHRIDREAFVIYVGSDPRQEQNTEFEAGVEHHMADRLELNLDILRHLDPARPILITMGTCGGDWEAGMQMFGAIVTAPNPITILGTRHSRSMSSIIPLAADRFLMRPPTDFMFHHGTWAYEGTAGGEASSAYQLLERSRDMMLRLYIARLREQGKWKNKHPSYIKHLLEDHMNRKVDCYLSTDEAVDWGFADGIALGPVKRIEKRNAKRRAAMMAVLRKPKGK